MKRKIEFEFEELNILKRALELKINQLNEQIEYEKDFGETDYLEILKKWREENLQLYNKIGTF